jgi:hypothetical protein
MKSFPAALTLVLLAGSAANAFTECYDLTSPKVIRQKSISACNAVPADNPRRNPSAVKPYTAKEKSLFQRLLRWEQHGWSAHRPVVMVPMNDFA